MKKVLLALLAIAALLMVWVRRPAPVALDEAALMGGFTSAGLSAGPWNSSYSGGSGRWHRSLFCEVGVPPSEAEEDTATVQEKVRAKVLEVLEHYARQSGATWEPSTGISFTRKGLDYLHGPAESHAYRLKWPDAQRKTTVFLADRDYDAFASLSPFRCRLHIIIEDSR